MEAKTAKVGKMDGMKLRVKQESHEGGNDNNSISVRIDPDVLDQKTKGSAANGDPDVFDCSICCTPLRPPVFQMDLKCHVCSLPTGRSRCRALEAVIEAMKIPRPHSTFGCRATIPYIQKDTHDHESSCLFAPCSCPISSCTFRGPAALLSDHIWNEHHSTTPQFFFSYNLSFSVFLQQEEPFYVLHGTDGRIFLLLNAANVPHGSSLSIACIRPGSRESNLGYNITVKGERSELRFRASPKNIRDLKVASPAESFLFVPHAISYSAGKNSIDVRIRISEGVE
ncbi:E3 ubiquitin-protein ligase SINA-like 10 [Phoenix dactylifera]|uniref:E3 ubiquitin-protein ligase SINA-like 10 n=1 Tax=Phoenix dactylifera TaxID=42345 RepID=A0A8B9AK83_PHODC|nr:E3 ubiquitin-protein ligase SINA-like 10 [Phoenix dactylifera]